MIKTKEEVEALPDLDGKTPSLTENIATLTEKDFELFQEIKSFLRDHIDFSDDRHYDLLACYLLVSQRIREFNTVPYLFYLGPPASGKSTAMNTCTSLVDRAIRTCSLTPATLFRIVDKQKPPLLGIDESEIINDSKSAADFIALLNAGYERGTPAYRLEQVKDGAWEVREFDVFGCKMVAGTKNFRFDTVMSRCIVVNMERRSRKVRFTLDKDRAEQIKGEMNSYAERWSNNTTAKSFVPEEWGSDRVAQLFQPLFEVAPTKEVEEILRSLATDLAKRRALEDQSGHKSMIIKAFEYVVGQQLTLTESKEPLRCEIHPVFEAFRNQLAAEYGEEQAGRWREEPMRTVRK